MNAFRVLLHIGDAVDNDSSSRHWPNCIDRLRPDLLLRSTQIRYIGRV